jgi:F-box domain
MVVAYCSSSSSVLASMDINITRQIFTYLPIKDILILSTSSRTCRTLIDSDACLWAMLADLAMPLRRGDDSNNDGNDCKYNSASSSGAMLSSSISNKREYFEAIGSYYTLVMKHLSRHRHRHRHHHLCRGQHLLTLVVISRQMCQ